MATKFSADGKIAVNLGPGPFSPNPKLFFLPRYTDRLAVMIRAESVKRPDAKLPLGLPADWMKAFLSMQANLGLIRIQTAVTSAFRLYVPPAESQATGLTPAQRNVLHNLVMPLSSGDLPAFLPGQVSLAEAIEQARQLELVFSDESKIDAALQFLRTLQGVISAERPVWIYPVEDGGEQGTVIRPPNPGGPPAKVQLPLHPPNWWRKQFGWDAGVFSKAAPSNIAVLDSGTISGTRSNMVMGNHPVLPAQAVIIPDWTKGDYAYYHTDDHGHGTHVASIVAGRDNNSFQATMDNETVPMPGGVLPNATVTCFRIFDDAQKGQISRPKFLSALAAIADKPAFRQIRVVNLSIWFGDEPDSQVKAALDKLEQRGVLVCVCAGNNFAKTVNLATCIRDANYTVLYPARMQRIVSVGAVTSDGNRADFSRFTTRGTNGRDGNAYDSSKPRFPHVDIAAPGYKIWGAMIQKPLLTTAASITQNGFYAAAVNGTSMATPMVSAVAGFLFNRWQQATPAQIRSVLSHCVNPGWGKMPPTPGWTFPVGTEEWYGAGVLDFARVAQLAQEPKPPL